MTTNFIVLELGAIGLKVTKLQSALKQLNFYFAAIDGIFGAKTRVAVIKFQQSYNYLADNGFVDVKTILQLDEAVWLSQKEVLQEDSIGEEVKVLQKMFIVCGIQSLTVDGYFGSKTKEAVIEFQKNCSLQADGIVEKETWAGLYRHQVEDISDEDRVNHFFENLDREVLSYRYGKILDFTQGKEFETVEDATLPGETVIHRFKVESKQNFRIIIRSLEHNAVFGLVRIADEKVYAQQASNSQIFLEEGEYTINVSAMSGDNTNYKLFIESIINC